MEANRTRDIRVLIVEDHVMVAEGLEQALREEEGIEPVGHVATLAAALAGSGPVDVILLDQRLPDGDGVRATPALLERYPGAQVLLVTGAPSHAVTVEAMRQGCRGCVSKDDRIEELVAAIHTVNQGGTALSSSLVPALLSSFSSGPPIRDRLTEREVEVVRLLAEGRSTADIAAQLVISRNTVRNHVRNALMKLGAHSQREAVAIALREGIVSPPR